MKRAAGSHDYDEQHDDDYEEQERTADKLAEVKQCGQLASRV